MVATLGERGEKSNIKLDDVIIIISTVLVLVMVLSLARRYFVVSFLCGFSIEGYYSSLQLVL